MTSPEAVSFADFGLPEAVQKSLVRLGYETPSPIQEQCIPLLLKGHDIIGQAQTGTGKTAAFALPLLSRVDLKKTEPQILVLAPTRELAIQVSEAFQSYAAGIKGFHIMPIYGGQSYDIQLRQLKRGVHVVVGTPGRVMDHINRKTLKLNNLQALVLDEADEMLRMGFIDDVEWILGKLPEKRQIALFSATMPPAIQKVAKTYLIDPQLIRIKSKTQTAVTISQHFVQVNGYQKLDALTRILESSDYDAVLVFVRTKNSTVDLSEKLEARGFAAEALNGDIPQKQRERIIEKLKGGSVDIVVATDVAARGIDVSRISLVVNFDIPYDGESYVHRIGRTGRAGRTGEAILFVTHKERHLLRSIEKLTQHKIDPLQLPTTEVINQKRMQRFKDRIHSTLETDDLSVCSELVDSFVKETQIDPLKLSAALVKMVQGDEPLLIEDSKPISNRERKQTRETRSERPREARNDRPKDSTSQPPPRPDKEIKTQARPLKEYPDIAMRRYRLDVGYQHDAKPGNIVGAIANEAEIDSCYIGHIDIYDDFTLIDLPDGMPGPLFKILKKTRVCGQALNIRAYSADDKKALADAAPSRKPRKSKPKHQKRKGKRPAVAERKKRQKES